MITVLQGQNQIHTASIQERVSSASENKQTRLKLWLDVKKIYFEIMK